MKFITVEGVKYKVIDNLGFNHDAGCYAKVVFTEHGERVAVRETGLKEWRFWKVKIRPGSRPTGQGEKS